MHFLPNSTKGKQWSEKWQQNYFKLPPNTYNGQLENDGGASFPGNYSSNCHGTPTHCGYLNQSVTMWQDEGPQAEVQLGCEGVWWLWHLGYRDGVSVPDLRADAGGLRGGRLEL